MIRTWLLRLLRGTAASFLLGAVVGGAEVAIALHGSVTEMVNALQRLQIWGLNALVCGAIAALVGLSASAAVGAAAGHGPEMQALAAATERDPRHPWLPLVLGCALCALVLVEVLPHVLGGSGDGGARVAMALALAPIAGAALAVFLRLWLRRLDHTGKGAGLALLGLPTLLVMTSSLAVSAPMAGGRGSALRVREGLPSVLLITVDGLRADHVGASARVRTDALDWLGRKGVSFAQVATPSTAEAPPLAALLSGHHPLGSGFLADGQTLPQRLPGSGKDLRTLAQEFADEGYATGAFVSSAALDGKATGLSRGFGVYDDGVGTERRGWRGLAARSLLATLRAARGGTPPGTEVLRPGANTLLRFDYWLAYHYRENFFAWVHLADPRIPFLAASAATSDLLDPLPGGAGRAYSARVVQLDEMLGELMKAFETDGLLDSTLVVVCGTRGSVPGGRPTVDRAWTSVPLVMFGSGLEGGASLASPARLEDLAPTILSAAGYRRARMGDGVSLVPELEGGEPRAREIVTVGPQQADGGLSLAVQSGRWRHTREAGGRQALYDVEADPKELDDRSAAEAARLQEMASRAEALLGASRSGVMRERLAPAREAELRALDRAR